MTRYTEPPLQYIASRVEVDGNECWNWKLALNEAGYGTCRYAGRRHYAHRLSYMVFIGNISDGMQLDHLCRNQRCVNPLHLEPVTAAENVRRIPDRQGYGIHFEKATQMWSATIKYGTTRPVKRFRSKDRDTVAKRAEAWLAANPK